MYLIVSIATPLLSYIRDSLTRIPDHHKVLTLPLLPFLSLPPLPCSCPTPPLRPSGGKGTLTFTGRAVVKGDILLGGRLNGFDLAQFVELGKDNEVLGKMARGREGEGEVEWRGEGAERGRGRGERGVFDVGRCCCWEGGTVADS